MNFEIYLKRHYLAACKVQRGIDKDSEMLSMLRNGKNDSALVKSWMRQYNLLQGITASNRGKIANAFLGYARSKASHKRAVSEDDIEQFYLALLNILYSKVHRSWASATSKLLWCLYPKEIVIYDSFVWRSLVVMQALDDEMSRLPRLGRAPKIQSKSDIREAVRHYALCSRLVKLLLKRHKVLLQMLRDEHDEKYPYDVRIMDRLLWMIGNPSKVF